MIFCRTEMKGVDVYTNFGGRGLRTYEDSWFLVATVPSCIL